MYSLSCKKITSNPNTYILKGKVYVDCNKVPVPNAVVIFVDNGIEGNGTGIHNGNLVVGSDTTDANGNFEINYKYPDGVSVLIESNLTVGGVNTLYGVPDGKNLDNLEVFYNPSCALNIKLNVTKPYTSADTLQVNNLMTGVGNLKFAGPFTSGNLYSVNNYQVLKQFYYDAENPISDSTKYVGYRLNNNSWQVKNFVPLSCKNIDAVIEIK